MTVEGWQLINADNKLQRVIIMSQTKTLMLLRHAKSSWKQVGLSDHERPLNKRGERDAPRMGKLLRDERLLPELILSSTAVRARTTASLVANSSGYEGVVELNDQLYLATIADFVQALSELYYNYLSVLLVSHNPGLEEFVCHLTKEDRRLPTAALVVIELPISSWRDLTMQTRGKLKNMWTPKDLG